MKPFIFLILLFSFECSQAQYGCVDPQAVNYNMAATINDGSCIYNPTSFTLLMKDTLPAVLSEISGMAYWNGKLYVHNDSGNPAILYETDTTSGIITKEIYFDGLTNTDWEDISQDSLYFYIADAGNNAGDRTDLKIIKFPKTAVGGSYYDTILLNETAIIHFSYPDQVNFANNLYNTPFDCEALAYRNNLLHLFTKNWTGGPSVHYTIPVNAGTYSAVRVDSLQTNGTLITGACFAGNKQLMLLGYKNSGTAEASLWFIYEFDHTDSFFVKGNKRKINVGDALLVGQIEAICFADDSHGFVSNERFNPVAPVDIPQQLYHFGTSSWFPYSINTLSNEVNGDSLNFTAIPSPDQIDVYFTLSRHEQVNITLLTSKGKKIREKDYTLNKGAQHLRIEDLNLPAGIYYVLFQNSRGEKKFSKIFFQNR